MPLAFSSDPVIGEVTPGTCPWRPLFPSPEEGRLPVLGQELSQQHSRLRLGWWPSWGGGRLPLGSGGSWPRSLLPVHLSFVTMGGTPSAPGCSVPKAWRGCVSLRPLARPLGRPPSPKAAGALALGRWDRERVTQGCVRAPWAGSREPPG